MVGANRTLGPKRIGVWIRVSTEDQARGESPEHHEKRARLYAEAKGWIVREVYHLEAVSGKTVMQHPEAQRMLKDIRSGHITGLIFSKLARLARNTRELLDFADLFREHGADLISLQESIDTSSPAGRLLYTMIAALAEWERSEIGDRVAASIPIRAKLGKPISGVPPYGYHWVDGKLVPHPKEAPVRKLMYELFLEHRRKKVVMRILNERGYRTRSGGSWTFTTVKRLLADTTAKGEHRANYTKSGGQGKGWKLKSPEDWVIRKVPAIVSPEVWDACNEILAEQRKGWKKPARTTVNLFSGIAYCLCGSKMYVPHNNPKYVCTGCNSKIPVDDLEAVFHSQLQQFVLSPEEVASYLSKADENMREKESLLPVLEAERAKIIEEQDKLYQLYLKEGIDPREYARRNHPLVERLSQVDAELPKLQAELDAFRIAQLSREEVLAEARDLYARWPSLPKEEKRQIVEAITDKIVVGEGEVEIRLSYLLPFENAANLAPRSRQRGGSSRSSSAVPTRRKSRPPMKLPIARSQATAVALSIRVAEGDDAP